MHLKSVPTLLLSALRLALGESEVEPEGFGLGDDGSGTATQQPSDRGCGSFVIAK